MSEYIDRIAEQVQWRVDHAALEKVAGELEEHGYVKVVRCRDCRHMEVFRPFDVFRMKPLEHAEYHCTSSQFSNWDFPIEVDPDGYCAWAERKEVRDD